MGTTTKNQAPVELHDGDVIEITLGGESATALVLLASDDAVILDACDGSTPFVVRRDELVAVRVFDGTAA